MKFIHATTKRTNESCHDIIASFFFNARGDELERTVSGMFRCLLLQLLTGLADLQEVLDDTELVPWKRGPCPPLNVLKDLFQAVVSRLGRRSFTCFVDALDECDEQQVMDMIQYFDELAEDCTEKNLRLQVCFSSRHYSYINIQQGFSITLEGQRGHDEDLSNYFQSRLQIKDATIVEELRPQILEKAAGVFLWVVLVVEILNKENRRGRLAVKKRLAEVPSGLSELFS